MSSIRAIGIYEYSVVEDQWPRLVVRVDEDLAAFYRMLIPPSVPVNKPRWPAHITVVRAVKEMPTMGQRDKA
ncbi:hypothetical protein LCGC14_1600840 [marine sediment metagenome]|uniref:Uncharacterized protein n=1 Tax=marine sediment metagenome TaxID=412755 RepID=A0A0F9IXQ1_9ZZZZ